MVLFPQVLKQKSKKYGSDQSKVSKVNTAPGGPCFDAEWDFEISKPKKGL